MTVYFIKLHLSVEIEFFNEKTVLKISAETQKKLYFDRISTAIL